MERKKITLSVSPLLVLLAVIVMAGLIILKFGLPKKQKPLTIDRTPIVTTSIRSLGELTTACFYDEIVLSRSKPGSLSGTALGSIARDGFGKDLDDRLVIIARGTVRAGIDFRGLKDEDVSFKGDTVFIKLPNPQYLDVIVNPSDFEVFSESGKWLQWEVRALQDSARDRFIAEADAAALRSKAYEGAMGAVGNILTASGYKHIRFEHPTAYMPLPLPRNH